MHAKLRHIMPPEYKWTVTANLPDTESAREVQKAMGLLRGVESIEEAKTIAPAETHQIIDGVPTVTRVDRMAILVSKFESIVRQLDDSVLLEDLEPVPSNNNLTSYPEWATAAQDLLWQERKEVATIIRGLINQRGSQREGYTTVGEVRHAKVLNGPGKYVKNIGKSRFQFIKEVFTNPDLVKY